MAEKYIMIDFNDERAKFISEALANPTCKKILEHLSEKEEGLTATEISKELTIPINTAEYNLQKLLQSGLIENKAHFWSTRGKRMPVYRASNKKIVICPTKKSSSLKTIVPVLLITTAAAAIVRVITAPKEVLYDAVNSNAGPTLMAKSADAAAAAGAETARNPDLVLSTINSFGPWGWFLVGAWFAILITFLFGLKRSKNERR